MELPALKLYKEKNAKAAVGVYTERFKLFLVGGVPSLSGCDLQPLQHSCSTLVQVQRHADKEEAWISEYLQSSFIPITPSELKPLHSKMLLPHTGGVEAAVTLRGRSDQTLNLDIQRV